MTDRPRPILIVLVALAIVVGIGSEWLAYGSRIGFAALRDLFAGWLVAGSGLVAWAWVPSSRVGPLLVTVGLTWFVGTVADPLTQTGQLAGALKYVYVAVLVHAVVTWPTGRVSGSLDRVLIVGAYLVAVFPPLWERDVGLVVIAGLLAAGLLAQWSGQSQRTRRIRRPARLIGIGLAVALAGKGALAAVLRGQGVAYPGDSTAIWEIALVLVALGLAWSLIALERRRRGVTDLVVRLGEAGPVASAVDLAEAAALPDDAEIAAAIVRADEMAARNARLRDELTAQVRAIEASRRRLLEAEDDERAALRSRLTRGVGRRLEVLEQDLTDELRAFEGSIEARARLDRAIDQLRHALVELDELARGLDPVMLRERGLADALVDLAERSPVPVELSLQPVRSWEAGIQRALFYVASEALANVTKHAEASRAWLRLSVDGMSASLAVDDDGIGVAGVSEGRGLRGLRDRVDAAGGVLRISVRQPHGTSVHVTVPLETVAPM